MPHMASTPYTVRQAAHQLGLAERTITKYCVEGKLHATKFGKVWLIHSLEVTA